MSKLDSPFSEDFGIHFLSLVLNTQIVKFKFKRFGNCRQSGRNFQCSPFHFILVATYSITCHLPDVFKHKLLIFKSSIFMGFNLFVLQWDCQSGYLVHHAARYLSPLYMSFLMLFCQVEGFLSTLCQLPIYHLSSKFVLHCLLCKNAGGPWGA